MELQKHAHFFIKMPKRHRTKQIKYSLVWTDIARKMRWAGHVARIGETRGIYRVLVKKPEGRNHVEDARVHGRIILKWIFEKCE
jgi:hypothetical protein